MDVTSLQSQFFGGFAQEVWCEINLIIIGKYLGSYTNVWYCYAWLQHTCETWMIQISWAVNHVITLPLRWHYFRLYRNGEQLENVMYYSNTICERASTTCQLSCRPFRFNVARSVEANVVPIRSKPAERPLNQVRVVVHGRIPSVGISRWRDGCGNHND